MNQQQLQKVFLALVICIVIILIREYEWKQKIQTPPEIAGQASLVRVVDGDTIVVHINDVDEKIRIIGIDTPESVKPQTPVQCFAKEATAYITQLLQTEGPLRIETDPTQDTRDRNGRLLAHVFLGDTNIGETLIRNGYAYEYTYNDPYKYQYEYREAQRDAQKDARGLWSPDTCNGKR